MKKKNSFSTAIKHLGRLRKLPYLVCNICSLCTQQNEHPFFWSLTSNLPPSNLGAAFSPTLLSGGSALIHSPFLAIRRKVHLITCKPGLKSLHKRRHKCTYNICTLHTCKYNAFRLLCLDSFPTFLAIRRIGLHAGHVWKQHTKRGTNADICINASTVPFPHLAPCFDLGSSVWMMEGW